MRLCLAASIGRIARLISYMKLGAEYAPRLLIRPEIVGSFGDVVVVFTNCDPAAIERRQTRAAAFQRRNLKRRLPLVRRLTGSRQDDATSYLTLRIPAIRCSALRKPSASHSLR